MNPTNMLVAEMPAAPFLPADAPLAVHPTEAHAEKPFAKVMEGTIGDAAAEPVPDKDVPEKKGDEKKNDGLLAVLVNIPVASAALPLPVPAQTPAAIQVELPIISETNNQSQNPGPVSTTPIPVTTTTSTAPNASDMRAPLPSTATVPVFASSPPEKSATVPELPEGSASIPEGASKQSQPQKLQVLKEWDQELPSAEEVQPDKPSVPDGTVIAKRDNLMKRDVKADKSSEPAGKTLPLGHFSAIPKAEPGRIARMREVSFDLSKESAEPAHETLGIREKSLAIYGKPVAELQDFDVKLLPEEVRVDSVRAPQVEKMFSKISEQVVAFKRVGVDSMDAVVRPDERTEISLHLSLRNNGQVDMVARVERGDFYGLQGRWSELQSSLAQQGIHVNELHRPSFNNQNSFAESSRYFNAATGEQQQPNRETPSSPETLDEQPSLVSSHGPAKGRTATAVPTRSRGWEEWA